MKVNVHEKLTKAKKRQIADDWVSAFPGLTVVEPTLLLRRVGPLLHGIALERDRSNEQYLPIAHIHILPTGFGRHSLTLGVDLPTRRTGGPWHIRACDHKRDFEAAVEQMRKHSPFGFEGPLRLSEVAEIMKGRSRGNPRGVERNTLLDLALLYAWCGKYELAEEILEERDRLWEIAKKEDSRIRDFPPFEWEVNAIASIRTRADLRVIAERELETLGYKNLKEDEFVCD